MCSRNKQFSERELLHVLGIAHPVGKDFHTVHCQKFGAIESSNVIIQALPSSVRGWTGFRRRIFVPSTWKLEVSNFYCCRKLSGYSSYDICYCEEGRFGGKCWIIFVNAYCLWFVQANRTPVDFQVGVGGFSFVQRYREEYRGILKILTVFIALQRNLMKLSLPERTLLKMRKNMKVLGR